jgi:type VI secretion system protein ImpG
VQNKYYQDELSYLRELGREFAAAYPEVAPFLAERGSDPDVERLLEGFAFLSGRIRQKLDDEYPEITHALVQLLWPQYLRPIPSMAVLQFEPLPQALKETHRVPRGTLVDSVPVDGTATRFQTVHDVALHPVLLEGVELRMEAPPHLRLKFRLPEGVDLRKVAIPSLRLFIQGEQLVARALYLCLLHHLDGVTIRPADARAAEPRGGDAKAGDATIVLGRDAVRPVGFDPSEPLLPESRITFEGYRLLQEYFTFPAKFHFVDLVGLERLRGLGECRAFDVTFVLKRLPENMPALGTGGFLLNCCPIVNLFPHEADPIRLVPGRTEYLLRPAGSDPAHYEIHSVDRVSGLLRGTAKPQEYHPLFGFHHPAASGDPDSAYYRLRLTPSAVREGSETHISFVRRSGEIASILSDVEVVSLALTCSNRQLASKLRVGDISVPGPTSPVFARFRNISRVMPSVAPPLEGDIYWRLVSHLALNYLSLGDVENLRAIIGLYNFRGLVDRQAEQAGRQTAEGIKLVEIRPATRLLEGAPVRGVSIRLDMEEDNYAGEGDMYLFASILNEFFALYVTANSFSQLEVRGLKYGEVYRWPPRLGTQAML